MISNRLSYDDDRILNSVFNPEHHPNTSTVDLDAALPPDPHISNLTTLKLITSREIEAIQLVEQLTTISFPQSNSCLSSSPCIDAYPMHDKTEQHEIFLRSLSILSSLIAEYPEYASAYNNRAQLRRWRYGADLVLHSHVSEVSDALDRILEDLDTAIHLATPAVISAALSPAMAKLLSHAWTQRATVFWSLSKQPRNSTDDDCDDASRWRHWDTVRLEEQGSRCFQMAGMYGSELGRNMAVKTNPYAKLCAGIVKQAMRTDFRMVL